MVELRDNISADPRFEDPEAMDFTPEASSPVRAVGNCGAIGAVNPRVPEAGHHEH